MKKLMRLFTSILVIAILTTCCVISSNAAIPPQKYGDLDYDDVVTVIDATIIQCHLARIKLILGDTQEAADVDKDNEVTILDATLIQQYVARYDVEFPDDEYFLVDAYLYGVIPDYDSGKAMASIPVNFYVDGFNEPGPSTVKLYVDHELVVQTSELGLPPHEDEYVLTHTFEKAGTYDLVICVCDKWGESLDWRIDDYVVVDPVTDTSKPIITSIRRDSLISLTPEFIAQAQYGTAPYEYKFELYSTWYFDDEGIDDYLIASQDFSEDDTFEVDLRHYGTGGLYKIIVTVRDSNGAKTTESQIFEIHTVDPA